MSDLDPDRLSWLVRTTREWRPTDAPEDAHRFLAMCAGPVKPLGSGLRQVVKSIRLGQRETAAQIRGEMMRGGAPIGFVAHWPVNDGTATDWELLMPEIFTEEQRGVQTRELMMELGRIVARARGTPEEIVESAARAFCLASQIEPPPRA